MRKMSARRQIVSQLALVALGLFVLIPVWALVNLSVDADIRTQPTHFRLWPKHISLQSFGLAWANPTQDLAYLDLLGNSLIVSLGSAAVAVAFGLSCAYAFARYRFPGRQAGLFGLLLGTLLPPVALMTPLYLLLTWLHIRTSLLGLMVAYTAFAAPFCLWTMRTAFQAIPLELEEAALVDGATPWITLTRISLPLALPSIGVTALIAFLMSYTEFALGWLFVERSDTVTLGMAVSVVVGYFGRGWSVAAAFALLMCLPVVGVFLLLRRYLIEGLSLGAVHEGK